VDSRTGKLLGAHSCGDNNANRTCEEDTLFSNSPFQISTWQNHLFTNCTSVLPKLRASYLLSQDGGFLDLFNDTVAVANWGPNFTSAVNVSSEQELESKMDEWFACQVFVDSVVLFHFPLSLPPTRDICTNSGYGDFFSYVPHIASTDPAVYATVSAVTFGMHDLRLDIASISKYCTHPSH
jgi:hypothetical protein